MRVATLQREARAQARARARAPAQERGRPQARPVAAAVVAVVVGAGLLVAPVLALAADAFKATYDKGAAAYAAGDYAGALAAFEAAFKIKPHPLCLFNIGQSHRKMEHIDEAIGAYEKFLATKPVPDLKAETDGYLTDLRRWKAGRVESDAGRKLFTSGDYAGAAARFEKAYEVRPEPALLFSTGQAYEKAGNKAKAIEYYERFLKTDTDPKLRADAEVALRALRDEPDPAGRTGGPGTGTGGPGVGATASPLTTPPPGTGGTDAVTTPPPEKSGGSKVVVIAAVGGGAAVAVGVAVVLIVVLTGGPKIPETALGNMEVSF